MDTKKKRKEKETSQLVGNSESPWALSIDDNVSVRGGPPPFNQSPTIASQGLSRVVSPSDPD